MLLYSLQDVFAFGSFCAAQCCQSKDMRSSYDGGLREHTPPTYRKGPAPSVGAARLLGKKQTGDTSPSLEEALFTGDVGVPTASKHQMRIFVPTVEHMHTTISAATSQPQSRVVSSPSRRSSPPPSRATAPSSSFASLVSTESIAKALRMLTPLISSIPRFVPPQPLEAASSLGKIVENRAIVQALLVDALADVEVLGARMAAIKADNERLKRDVAQLTRERDTAVDLGVAADAQLVTAAEEMRALQESKKALAAEFEKKVHYLVHKDAPVTRTTAAEYRTAECARMERECDELRAQLTKRDAWRVERSALLESIARETRLREAAANEVASLQHRISALETQLQTTIEQHRSSDELQLAEHLKLGESLQRWQLQRSNPRQTETIKRCMQERAFRARASRTWRQWFGVYVETMQEKAVMENTAEQQLRQVALEGRLLKAKEEKAILIREVTHLTRMADDHMLRQQSHQQSSHQPGQTPSWSPIRGQPTSATPTKSITQEEDPATKSLLLLAFSADAKEKAKVPTSLIDIVRNEQEAHKPKHKIHQDPQVQAIKAYHMLSTVLHGIKRRLGLESLRIPALPLTERSTESVPRVVFDWIQDVFEFLHHIMSVEDRLLKAKVKIAFMNIRLGPDMKRIAAQMHFCSSDAAQTDVLKRQLNGYVEIQRAIKALKGHIEATAKALVSSSDPKKHDQIRLLTQTFEADVSTFLDRVEYNRKMQFQFELQLRTLRDQKAALIDRLLGGDGSGTSSPTRRSQPGSPSHRKAMLEHGMAPEGAGITSPGMTTASPVSPATVMTKQVSIGELLPTLRRFGSVGSWAPDAASRPITSDVLQSVVALDKAALPKAMIPASSDPLHDIPFADNNNMDPNHSGQSSSRRTPVVDLGDTSNVLMGDDDDYDRTAGNDPELEYIATEEGLQALHPPQHDEAQHDEDNSGHKSSNAPLLLTRHVPSVEDIARILARDGALKRLDAPKVPDPWAERCKEGYRITSILRAGADGKIDAKEFLRLSQGTTAIAQSVRRSLDSEILALNKAKARQRRDAPIAPLLASATALAAQQQSQAGTFSHAHVKSAASLHKHVSQQPQGPPAQWRCDSATSHTSTSNHTATIAHRDNLVRPAVVGLSEHRLRVPSSESSDVIHKLLPRHRAQ
ncbi:Hypothetical protein, putative [Bodo saltans]|uniref:Uncharacterized protein n=1 Tax=Bodo saltans TaxID=75058 RepID=A0A0S4KE54_BODSA|nr:Hypothetical protein, putative [Bodo saltans]|eukprot:CUI12375.1 Hypothetical protein, putative [Bodo saltans]